MFSLGMVLVVLALKPWKALRLIRCLFSLGKQILHSVGTVSLFQTSTASLMVSTNSFLRLEGWKKFKKAFSIWSSSDKQKFSSSYFITRISNWVYSIILFVVNTNSNRTQREQQKWSENQYCFKTEKKKSLHSHDKLVTQHISKL